MRHLALDKLREAILSMQLPPGERLVERKLGEQLGVSRTVVREVLRQLESEGLVNNLAHQGPIVTELDVSAVVQIYELRSALESLAASACAGRRDNRQIATKLNAALNRVRKAYAESDLRAVLTRTPDFYRIMFEAGEKRVAWEMQRNLMARISSLRSMTISSSGRSETGPAEMQAIVDAIAAGDPAKAAQASRRHVATAQEIALARLAVLKPDLVLPERPAPASGARRSKAAAAPAPPVAEPAPARRLARTSRR